MNKNKKEIEKRLEKMSSEEIKSFHTFGKMFLDIFAETHADARMLKAHSDLTDEMKNIIDEIWFNLPEDKRDENEKTIKKFTGIMEQFLQVCRDFKKENV